MAGENVQFKLNLTGVDCTSSVCIGQCRYGSGGGRRRTDDWDAFCGSTSTSMEVGRCPIALRCNGLLFLCTLVFVLG